MSIVKNVVICAAGMGTRLGYNIPKCLVEVNGRRIIDYQLDLLENMPNIYIVVGYMEDEVMAYVSQRRRDIIFVRNAHYIETSTRESLNMAVQYLQAPFLSLDGDLIIDADTFQHFLKSCKVNQSLIGVTPAKTEDAVYVDYNPETQQVHHFSRTQPTPYEWANIAWVVNLSTEQTYPYVYNLFEKALPLPGQCLDVLEIDTEADLKRVEAQLAQQKVGRLIY